jgi:hypothetical protein
MVLPNSAFIYKKRIKRRGHAWQPGTGPEGETCKTCRFISHKRMGNTYIKCGHPSAPKWTGGPGTDIRARDPACIKWESNPLNDLSKGEAGR